MNKNFVALTPYWLIFACVLLGPKSPVLGTTDSAQKPNPVPLISQPLVPDTIAPGSSEFTLTINGTGFARRAVVKWNGHDRATTFVSNHRLTADIRASDVANASTGIVTVVNCGPGGGTSNVVLFPVTTPASFLSFTQSDLTAGQEAFAMTTGDFNEDGKTDLAFADYQAWTVNIFLGNGDGTFQPVMTYPTGDVPTTIATGDFNEDGHLDLVTNGLFGYGMVCILLGNGDGTFGPHTDFGGIRYEGTQLTTADLNGDGNMDVVITDSFYSSTVSVFLGNGDGTLQPPAAYEAGQDPLVPVVGDFNRDGKLDLAVTSDDSNNYVKEIVSILIGNGDGSFQPPVAYDVGAIPFGVTTADFNGDGLLDLAVANRNDNTVSVLLGKGDGTFQPRVNYATDAGPVRVTTGDLNSDGYLDLIVDTPGGLIGSTLSILEGNGDGTFRPYVSQEVGTSPGAMVIADFNRDGRLDLGVARDYSKVSILLQLPSSPRLPPSKK